MIGITGRMGERIAAGLDDEMGRTVLHLLRAAKQPVMSDAGKTLARAARRPGLALIAIEDLGRASGTIAQPEWGGREAGAELVHLEGVGHWWPAESPAPIAEALTRVRAGLDAAAA